MSVGEVKGGDRLAAVERGSATGAPVGFTAELHAVLSSVNARYSSYARIHNGGFMNAPATLTVCDDTTGALLGRYKTQTIAPNQTLQLSTYDIERAIGVIPARGKNFSVLVEAPFAGHAQHLIFDANAGQIVSLPTAHKGRPSDTSEDTGREKK